MRSISRIVGVSINTVTKLLVDAGIASDLFQEHHVRKVNANQIQCDEIWSFCYAKDKTINRGRVKGYPERAGTNWLWTAIDPESKLIVSWHLSESRDEEQAFYFIQDLRGRLANRVQISTDGNFQYQKVIPTVFAGKVDFAQVIKEYESGRYVGSTKKKITGNPDYQKIGTTFMERHNLTTRMSLRRYNRKTNAHSKKLEYHYLALSLYFCWYNWIRVHSTIGTTPAVVAGLTKFTYDMEHILDLIDAVEYLEKHKDDALLSKA